MPSRFTSVARRSQVARPSWAAFFLLVSLAFLNACRPSGPPYLVYITNEASGDVTVIDPVKLEAVSTIALGKRPRGIHASADGKLIYVTLSGSPFAPPGVDKSKLPPPDKSADGIGVVDASAGRMIRKLPSGSDPEQFAISRDGKMLYVSNEDAAGLSFLDLEKAQIVTSIPTGDEPEGVTLSPDEKQVYVTSENDGTVTAVDVATAKVLKKIKVGLRPRSIAFVPNGSLAYVSNENSASLSVIDTAKLEVIRTISVDEKLKPMGLAMSRDGSRLFVSTGRGKKVLLIELPAENIAASFEVGDRPWGIALSPDEKYLFTANGPSNDVSVVDVATRTVVKKIKAGDRPWGVLTLSRE